MKLTESQLKQIIKEELQEQADHANCVSTDQLQDMYEAWQPQTDEGIQYKEDLVKLLR